MAVSVQTPQGQVLSPLAAFNANTRRNRRMLSSVQGISQFGSLNHIDVSQVGYLQGLDIRVYGTVTMTAQGSATAQTLSPYFPWNIVQQIVLRSNEGLELYRTRGYTNHVLNDLRRGALSRAGIGQRLQAVATPPNYLALGTGLDGGIVNPFASNQGSGIGLGTAVTTTQGTGGSAVGLVMTPYGQYTPGTTAGVFAFNMMYRIPISIDPRNSTGLLLLQNPQTRLSLDITMMNSNDLFLGTAVSNHVGAASMSANIDVRQTFFSPPADPAAQPDTQFVHRIIEDNQAWTTTGDTIYHVPVGNAVLRVLTQAEINAGASQAGSMVPYSAADGAGKQPAIHWQTKNRADTSNNFGNMQVSYAASSVPENTPTIFNALDVYDDYGAILPDGWMLFDFALGAGFPENGYSGRDIYDTSRLTEFDVTVNWANSTAPPSGSQLLFTREELAARAS